MKLIELMCLANLRYPDAQLAAYYDKFGRFKDNPHGGDGLARFIVIELNETFDPEASDEQQRDEAIRVMTRAREDVDAVLTSLENGGIP